MDGHAPMSPKIDDPLEASLEAWPEEPEGWDKKGRELALTFSGLCFTPAAVLKILKDQFLSANRVGRIQYLLDGLVLKLKAIDSELADAREKQKEVQARIEGSQFQEAVAAACEETVRVTDQRKIQRLAAVLAGSLSPGQWADPKADLAAMIRDIAQLGDQDIHALDLLKAIFASTVAHLPNLNDQNQFTERMQDYRTAIAQAKIDP